MLCNKATISHFTAEKVRDIPVVFPKTGEQQAIAAFLDRETARIDGLVAKKRRLIELLREKRTALISHAVTRGLDPHAPVKPSGVDWLGDVPAHWEIKRLKHIVVVKSGGTPDVSIPEYWNGIIPWVSPKDMITPTITDTQDHIQKPVCRTVRPD